MKRQEKEVMSVPKNLKIFSGEVTFFKFFIVKVDQSIYETTL
jgi:hypothetical protein